MKIVVSYICGYTCLLHKTVHTDFKVSEHKGLICLRVLCKNAFPEYFCSTTREDTTAESPAAERRTQMYQVWCKDL